MADEPEPQSFIAIGGVPIEGIVNVTAKFAAEETWATLLANGVKRCEPITLTIDFDTRQKCCACGHRFVAGPEGVPVLIVDGEILGDVCVECGVALEGTTL